MSRTCTATAVVGPFDPVPVAIRRSPVAQGCRSITLRCSRLKRLSIAALSPAETTDPSIPSERGGESVNQTGTVPPTTLIELRVQTLQQRSRFLPERGIVTKLLHDRSAAVAADAKDRANKVDTRVSPGRFIQ